MPHDRTANHHRAGRPTPLHRHNRRLVIRHHVRPACTRQYTGTAGRVENCQVGVFLAYVTPDGSRALIDRELYLPEKWTFDRDRCRAARIGDDVAFATKPELAQKMIGRAVEAGMPFAVGGRTRSTAVTRACAAWLEEEASATSSPSPAASRSRRRRAVPARTRWPALVPAAGWQRLSCADGSKGPRLDDWALIGAAAPGHQLLIRRSLHPGEKGEPGAGLSSAAGHPARPPWPNWSPSPGARWGVEDCFAEAKNETGLDHYQVRTLPRLVPPRHLVHARACLPGRHRHAARPAASPASGAGPREKGA